MSGADDQRGAEGGHDPVYRDTSRDELETELRQCRSDHRDLFLDVERRTAERDRLRARVAEMEAAGDRVADQFEKTLGACDYDEESLIAAWRSVSTTTRPEGRHPVSVADEIATGERCAVCENRLTAADSATYRPGGWVHTDGCPTEEPER